jgi:hypothetical protein
LIQFIPVITVITVIMALMAINARMANTLFPDAGVLAKHPNVILEIKEKLQGLCKSSLTVNVIIGRAIMLAVINDWVPELFTSFKCSEVGVQLVLFLFEANLKLQL